MQQLQIKDRVFEVAAKLFGEEASIHKEDKNLVEAFGMSSIDVLEFLLAIETEFDFEFDDEALDETTLQNVDNLIGYINSKI